MKRHSMDERYLLIILTVVALLSFVTMTSREPSEPRVSAQITTPLIKHGLT